MGGLDSVPGGNFNSADDTKHAVYKELIRTNAFSFPLSGSWYLIPFLWTGQSLKVEQRLPSNIDIPISPQAFIPTHSALDTSGFLDWYQSINKNLVCSGQTPFDSYYGENSNMGHISFTENMVNWLMKNINDGIQAPHFPIQENALQGPSLVCENSNTNYTFGDICKIPSEATWTVTGNLELVSYTPLSLIVKGTGNGIGVLTATFQNGQVFHKEIWVGAPIFNNFDFTNNVGLSYCLAPTDQLKMDLPTDKVIANFDGMSNLEIFNNNNWQWQVNNNLIMLNSSNDKNTRTICPMGSGLTSFKVRAKNQCGWSDWYEIPEFEITMLNPNWLSKQSTNKFIIYPNPSDDIVNITLKDIDRKDNITNEMNAELFDIIGSSKTKFKIINNNATFSVNGLSKGIYTLKIYLNNEIETHQISVK
jgi:hypothetical protein